MPASFSLRRDFGKWLLCLGIQIWTASAVDDREGFDPKLIPPCLVDSLLEKVVAECSRVGEVEIKGHVSDSVPRRAQSFIAVVLKHAFFVFAVSHSSLLTLWAAAIHAIRKILLFRHDMPPMPLTAGILPDLNREGSSFASKLKGLCEFNAINMLAQQIKNKYQCARSSLHFGFPQKRDCEFSSRSSPLNVRRKFVWRWRRGAKGLWQTHYLPKCICKERKKQTMLAMFYIDLHTMKSVNGSLWTHFCFIPDNNLHKI